MTLARPPCLSRFGPLDGPQPNEVTSDFAYLPFGGGRRKCIGDQFALFESIVALSMLVRRYNFTPTPGTTVGMTTGLWLRAAETWFHKYIGTGSTPTPATLVTGA